MPKGVSRFSTRTIVDVLPPLFDLLTNSEIDILLLSFGLHDIAPHERLNELGKYFAKRDRALLLAKYLIENPNVKGIYESDLIFEIFDYIIDKYSMKIAIDKNSPLINSLNRDGYTIKDGKLRTVLPEEIQLPEKENRLEELLRKFNFATTKGHLDQAISAHSRGEWASANSQLRNVVESLFDSIADELAKRKIPPITLPTESYQKREFLTRETFFQETLNEWCIGGSKCSFIDGVWKRLQPNGSHPGLSDMADSTFRLHLVILTTTYFLEKFDSWS